MVLNWIYFKGVLFSVNLRDISTFVRSCCEEQVCETAKDRHRHIGKLPFFSYAPFPPHSSHCVCIFVAIIFADIVPYNKWRRCWGACCGRLLPRNGSSSWLPPLYRCCILHHRTRKGAESLLSSGLFSEYCFCNTWSTFECHYCVPGRVHAQYGPPRE